MRSRLYQKRILQSHKPVLPTICVGNFSVGGTGKTPLVAYITKQLSMNSRVGILTRGYGSQVAKSSPHLAAPDSTAALIGDEGKLYQLLLSKNPPLLAISPDRVAGVKMLAEAGAEICIMDDGLQHLRINPDIKLCLIDIADASEYLKVGTSSLLPAGIFRESPEKALARIDRVIFTCKTRVGTKEKDIIRKIAQHLEISSYSIIEFRATTARDGFSGEITSLDKSKHYILLSAIAKPDPLIQAWNDLGAQLSQIILLPDHHPFKQADWDNAKRSGTVVCSGKDWVKLIPFLKTEGELLVLEQEILDLSEPGDKLLNWLESRIEIKKINQNKFKLDYKEHD